jgi:hypothetical protein
MNRIAVFAVFVIAIVIADTSKERKKDPSDPFE